MPHLKAHAEGKEALRRVLVDQVPYGLRTRYREALWEQARKLRDYIKSHKLSGQVLKRRTSRLYRSIRAVVWGNEGFFGADVYTDVFYGRFQEFGFKHYLSGKIVHNPFMAPSLREKWPSIRQALREAVRESRP